MLPSQGSETGSTPVSRSKMRFFSRILAFALNAYLDAQICEELVSYIKTKGKSYATKETTAQQRAKKLVSSAKDKKTDYLIGLAYTEYYINGLADILYSKILFKLLIAKDKGKLKKIYEESTSSFKSALTTRHQFQEFISNRSLYLKYWFAIVTNPWRWANKFAKERCKFEGKLDTDLLRKAAIEVQKQNLENNGRVARDLRNEVDNDDVKITELNRLARKYKNSDFLIGAAKTQETAARWDKLFVKLIDR